MPAARKTTAETRAEARAAGFEDCMSILRHAWRSRARPGTAVVMADLWPILELMDKHAGLLTDDVNAMHIPRVYGTEFHRLRFRVELVAPHPHKGQRGVVLWSQAFEEEGLYQVFFIRPQRRITSAFARRGDWRWVDKPDRKYRDVPRSPADEDEENANA